MAFGSAGGFWRKQSGGVCTDPDASAFISSTGISDPIIEAAICQFTKDLKGIGSTPSSSDIWSKSFAIYPMVGASKTTTSYNLRDTSAFQMTWVDVGAGHSFLPIGVGRGGAGNYSYGRTGFIPATHFDSNTSGGIHYGYFPDAAFTGGAHNPIFGSQRTSPAPTRRCYLLATGSGPSAAVFQYAQGSNVSSGGVTSISPPFSKMSSALIDSGTAYGYNEGTIDVSAADAGTLSDLELFLMARNNNGSLSGQDSASYCQFGAITKYLNSTEMADLWDAVLRFQTNLGRES